MTDDLDRADDRVVLRYERVLRHPVEDVWRAITDPDEITAWWGTTPEIDLRVGGEYVSHHATGDRVVDRIVRLEPPHLLEHTFWQHLNPAARVTYELSPVAAGTLLVLTHAMTESDLRTAAEALSWQGDPYDLMSRTAAGWPRLLTALDSSLRR
ncbi:MAG: SRPBCC domain-containing protein [Frankiaceae bacterium]